MHTLFEAGERGFIITDIGRLIHKVFEQRVTALGYGKSHWQVLAYLAQNPGTMQATLANHMEVEPITLSRHLDRLENDGVVERRSDMKDRRVKRLYLTAQGEVQMCTLKTVRDEIVNTIHGCLEPEEAERIREGLVNVRYRLLDMLK